MDIKRESWTEIDEGGQKEIKTNKILFYIIQHSVVNYLNDHMKIKTFKRTYALTLYLISDLDKLKVSFSNI